MGKFTQAQLDEINPTLNTPQDALKWALDNLHPRVAKASSFGAEDSVIIDMMAKINPKARFFTLDTGRLNPETYTIMAELSKKHNITFEVMFPDAKEEGYPSIGCEPCTQTIKPGEDLRTGRWWWESNEHKECSLHMDTGA